MEERKFTYVEEIDLSNKAIKDYFELSDDYEITEEDRELYFGDIMSDFIKNHKLESIKIFSCEYVHD